MRRWLYLLWEVWPIIAVVVLLSAAVFFSMQRNLDKQVNAVGHCAVGCQCCDCNGVRGCNACDPKKYPR